MSDFNKMKNPYIRLKIVDKSGRTLRKVASRKSKRIFCFIREEKSKDCVFEVCVNYGGGFKNEGEYTTKKDLLHAIRAFLEK